MKCVVLTTDTVHHRFFVNSISRKISTTVVLETRRLDHWNLYWASVKRRKTPWSLIDNPYIHLNYKRFEELQNRFEERFFVNGLAREFQDYSSLHEYYSVNDEACIDLITKIRPHFIVSFGTGLIGKGILQINALKMNIHRGILPKYRGLDSDLWAFYLQDFDTVGTTVHKLEARFDTGAILQQEKLQIQPAMKSHHIRFHTTNMAKYMVERIIDACGQQGDVTGTEQDLSLGSYYSYIPPLKRLVATWRFNRYVASLQ